MPTVFRNRRCISRVKGEYVFWNAYKYVATTKHINILIAGTLSWTLTCCVTFGRDSFTVSNSSNVILTLSIRMVVYIGVLVFVQNIYEV
jgi:predicted membrane protein